MRRAGFAVPLFSLRSARGGAIGEIDDLIPLVDWAADHGLSVIALLPLGELAPGESSPYNALSSFAIDPLLVTPESLDELAGESLPDRPPHPSAGVDREAARAWKAPLFDDAHARFRALLDHHPRRAAFEEFRGATPWLADYALFRALLDENGGRWWRDWPEPIRKRDGRAIAAARRRLRPRIERWEYLQFAADSAWRRVRAHAAARDVLLMGDLPFAPSENSACVWSNAALFDPERSVGAPPDAFSETGQRWGLPMYRWSAMRAQKWRWFGSRVRRMAELYDLFRVDHVVGLFRTFGFAGASAVGFDPDEEPAQIAQGREILEMMVDAGRPAVPVAEDLGVIPDWVIETLAELDLPGHKVLRWVETPPEDYPECSMATTGTHDTSSLVAWWAEITTEERATTLALLGMDAAAPDPPLSESLRMTLIERLFRSPSRLVVLPVQDFFGWPDRINTPATVGPENWSYRLPVAVEHLATDAGTRPTSDRLARLIDAAGRLRKIKLTHRAERAPAAAPASRSTRID